MAAIPLYPVDLTDPPVSLDVDHLARTRMLIQGSSGGGKSWCLRYILEQSFGSIPHIVLDAEGEFDSLRERFPYILIGTNGDVPLTLANAATLGRKLITAGASAILNLSDLEKPQRRSFMASFLGAMLDLPQADWRPYLVIIDEAHEYAPERGICESAPVIAALTSKGRKRGFGAILATQRISKLSKDAAADLHNVLIGLTSLDVDIARAGDTLGFDKTARARLRLLEAGQFYAYGPAISRTVTLIRTGQVKTSHDHDQHLQPPPAPMEVHALITSLALDLDSPATEKTVADAPTSAGSNRVRRYQLEAQGIYSQTDVDQAVREACHPLQLQLSAWQAYATALRERIDAGGQMLQALTGQLVGDLPQAPASPTLLDTPQPPVRQPAPISRSRLAPEQKVQIGDEKITNPQQRILDALRTLERLGISEPQRNNVAVFAQQSPRSSGFTNNLSRLRTLALVAYPTSGTVCLTEQGRSMTRDTDEQVITIEDVHQAWMRYLPKPQARIVEVLIRAYPIPMDRGDVAQQAQQSPTSSGFTNNLSALRSLGLVTYPTTKTAVATTILFPVPLSKGHP